MTQFALVASDYFSLLYDKSLYQNYHLCMISTLKVAFTLRVCKMSKAWVDIILLPQSLAFQQTNAVRCYRINYR